MLGGALGVGGCWALQRGLYRRTDRTTSAARPETGLASAASVGVPPPPAPPEAPVQAPHRGPTDVTFLVISDLHFGAYMDGKPLEPVLMKAVGAMNSITGRPYPPAIGGKVGEVRGVLAAGDLTEDGHPHEWNRFVETMGLHGGEGALRHPVFESLGNHDLHAGWHVRRGIEQRHGATHYAWSWDALRFYCLAEGPDDDRLQWLQADLEKLPADAGIVVYQHYPFAGGFSRGHWFGDGDYKAKLAGVLSGRRVHGVFHGHHHATGAYRWSGHDVYLAGSPKHSWRSFLVVRVTDEKKTVAAYHYEQDRWWWWHERSVQAGRGERRYFAPDASFVRA